MQRVLLGKHNKHLAGLKLLNQFEKRMQQFGKNSRSGVSKHSYKVPQFLQCELITDRSIKLADKIEIQKIYSLNPILQGALVFQDSTLTMDLTDKFELYVTKIIPLNLHSRAVSNGTNFMVNTSYINCLIDCQS